MNWIFENSIKIKPSRMQKNHPLGLWSCKEKRILKFRTVQFYRTIYKMDETSISASVLLHEYILSWCKRIQPRTALSTSLQVSISVYLQDEGKILNRQKFGALSAWWNKYFTSLISSFYAAGAPNLSCIQVCVCTHPPVSEYRLLTWGMSAALVLSTAALRLVNEL